MSRVEEIKNRITKLKNEIFYEDMKDSGWDFSYVHTRQLEIKSLEKELVDIESGH